MVLLTPISSPSSPLSFIDDDRSSPRSPYPHVSARAYPPRFPKRLRLDWPLIFQRNARSSSVNCRPIARELKQWIPVLSRVSSKRTEQFPTCVREIGGPGPCGEPFERAPPWRAVITANVLNRWEIGGSYSVQLTIEIRGLGVWSDFKVNKGERKWVKCNAYKLVSNLDWKLSFLKRVFLKRTIRKLLSHTVYRYFIFLFTL